MTTKKNLDKIYRARLLKGELTLQTPDEYFEYKKIPPYQKIKGVEEVAIMLNKLKSLSGGK